MRIPFDLQDWLKDKSQKIETRDGRIVHNIWSIKEPFYTNNKKAEVCALIDGEEDALVFFEGGRYLPTTQDTDSHFDLFIITPEPELSDFEKAVANVCFDWQNIEPENRIMTDSVEDAIKEDAAKLLAIARKELIEEQYTSDPRKTDLYKLGKAEALKEIEQNPESSYAFKRGVEYGKEEALKDLPRWKKAKEYKKLGLDDFCFTLDNDGKMSPYWDTEIEKGQYFITEFDLEKLPKED